MWKRLRHVMLAMLVLLAVAATTSALNIWNPAIQLLPKQDGVTSKSFLSCGVLEHLGADGKVHFDREGVSIGGVSGEVNDPSDAIIPKGSIDFDIGALAYHYQRISLRTGQGPWIGAIWQFKVRYALLAVLFAIYPAVFFIRGYRRRRANRQALRPCSQCGYDLQGNKSGVCPECGTAVEAALKDSKPL